MSDLTSHIYYHLDFSQPNSKFESLLVCFVVLPLCCYSSNAMVAAPLQIALDQSISTLQFRAQRSIMPGDFLSLQHFQAAVY